MSVKEKFNSLKEKDDAIPLSLHNKEVIIRKETDLFYEIGCSNGTREESHIHKCIESILKEIEEIAIIPPGEFYDSSITYTNVPEIQGVWEMVMDALGAEARFVDDRINRLRVFHSAVCFEENYFVIEINSSTCGYTYDIYMGDLQELLEDGEEEKYLYRRLHNPNEVKEWLEEVEQQEKLVLEAKEEIVEALKKFDPKTRHEDAERVRFLDKPYYFGIYIGTDSNGKFRWTADTFVHDRYFDTLQEAKERVIAKGEELYFKSRVRKLLMKKNK